MNFTACHRTVCQSSSNTTPDVVGNHCTSKECQRREKSTNNSPQLCPHRRQCQSRLSITDSSPSTLASSSSRQLELRGQPGFVNPFPLVQTCINIINRHVFAKFDPKGNSYLSTTQTSAGQNYCQGIRIYLEPIPTNPSIESISKIHLREGATVSNMIHVQHQAFHSLLSPVVDYYFRLGRIDETRRHWLDDDDHSPLGALQLLLAYLRRRGPLIEWDASLALRSDSVSGGGGGGGDGPIIMTRCFQAAMEGYKRQLTDLEFNSLTLIGQHLRYLLNVAHMHQLYYHLRRVVGDLWGPLLIKFRFPACQRRDKLTSDQTDNLARQLFVRMIETCSWSSWPLFESIERTLADSDGLDASSKDFLDSTSRSTNRDLVKRLQFKPTL